MIPVIIAALLNAALGRRPSVARGVLRTVCKLVLIVLALIVGAFLALQVFGTWGQVLAAGIACTVCALIGAGMGASWSFRHYAPDEVTIPTARRALPAAATTARRRTPATGAKRQRVGLR